MSIDINVKMDVRDLEEVTREAVRGMADDIQRLSREDITSGGFGRWAKGTRTSVQSQAGNNYTVLLKVRPGFLKAYEYGAVAIGRPMLWIPSPENSFKKTRAKRLVRDTQVKMFRPPGKNVLISSKTGKVMFIGIPSVKIVPRLHLVDIAELEASRFVERLKDRR